MYLMTSTESQNSDRYNYENTPLVFIPDTPLVFVPKEDREFKFYQK